MKLNKIMSLILILFFIFALSACDFDNDTKKDQTEIDCVISPEHENCKKDEVDCDLTPNHEDCNQQVTCVLPKELIDGECKEPEEVLEYIEGMDEYLLVREKLGNIDYTFDHEKVFGIDKRVTNNNKILLSNKQRFYDTPEQDITEYTEHPTRENWYYHNSWFQEPTLDNGFYEFNDLAEDSSYFNFDKYFTNQEYFLSLVKKRVDKVLNSITTLNVWVDLEDDNETQIMLRSIAPYENLQIYTRSNLPYQNYSFIAIHNNDAGEQVIQLRDMQTTDGIHYNNSSYTMVGSEDYFYTGKLFDIDSNKYLTQFRGVNRLGEFERTYYEISVNEFGKSAYLMFKGKHGWYSVTPDLSGTTFSQRPYVRMYSLDGKDFVMSVSDFSNNNRVVYQLGSSGFIGMEGYRFEDNLITQQSLHTQSELINIDNRGLTPLPNIYTINNDHISDMGIKTINGNFMKSSVVTNYDINMTDVQFPTHCSYGQEDDWCYIKRSFIQDFEIETSSTTVSKEKFLTLINDMGLTYTNGTNTEMLEELMYVNLYKSQLVYNFQPSYYGHHYTGRVFSNEYYFNDYVDRVHRFMTLDTVFNQLTNPVVKVSEQTSNNAYNNYSVIELNVDSTKRGTINQDGIDLSNLHVTVNKSGLLSDIGQYALYFQYQNGYDFGSITSSEPITYNNEALIFDNLGSIDFPDVSTKGTYWLRMYLGKSINENEHIRVSNIVSVPFLSFDNITFNIDQSDTSQGCIYHNSVSYYGGYSANAVTITDTLAPLITYGLQNSEINDELTISQTVDRGMTLANLLVFAEMVDDNIDPYILAENIHFYKDDVETINFNELLETGTYKITFTDLGGNTATLIIDLTVNE